MSTSGETLARQVDARIASAPADQYALSAIPAPNRSDGQTAMVNSTQTEWQFVLASTLPASETVVVPLDNPANGRWLASLPRTQVPIVPVDIKGAVLAAGTPLAAYAGSTPGITLDNSKAVGVRWKGGTLTSIWTAVDLPLDLDPTYPVTASLLVSKSGATAADVVSMTLAVYAQTVGALEDAGANIGGVSPALTSAQAQLPAKTVTELQVPIYLPPTAPARLSISIAPSGTLATDDLVLNGFWLEYVKRPAVARAQIDMRAAVLAAGTPMAAWANNAGASAPGITLDNSKAIGIRWNNQATLTAVWTSLDIPLDMDVTKPAVLVALVSKSGATVGDATTVDLGVYAQTPGALEDAGSNLGGTTSALVGNATAKTVAKLTLGIAPNTLPAGPGRLSISVKPTDGSLGTDDAIVNGLWLEYTRKNGTPHVTFDLKAAVLAAGTPMAAFADSASSAPGVTLDNSKAVGVRWNDAATQVAVWTYGEIPLDMDVTQPSTVVVLASKSGATAADKTTFDVGLFAQSVGALEDGATNAGGTTSALNGALAAKTVSKLTLTVAANALPAGPGRLSVSVKPTNGTLSADDAIVNGFWLEYVRKAS